MWRGRAGVGRSNPNAASRECQLGLQLQPHPAARGCSRRQRRPILGEVTIHSSPTHAPHCSRSLSLALDNRTPHPLSPPSRSRSPLSSLGHVTSIHTSRHAGGTTYVFVNVVAPPRYVARVQPGSGGLENSVKQLGVHSATRASIRLPGPIHQRPVRVETAAASAYSLHMSPSL